MKTFIVALLLFVATQIYSQPRVFNLAQFTFEDTLGRKYNLDSLRGKIVFVDCWFPACPPCREEMPYSFLLQKRLQAIGLDSNIVFVTINFKQTVKEWITAIHQLKMPNALHLYSPASTFEITLAGGNFPTYRLFNSAGFLDAWEVPAPSSFIKTDFVLFCSTKNIHVKDALSLYESEVQVKLKNKNFISTNKVVDEFVNTYLPFMDLFKKEFIQQK